MAGKAVVSNFVTSNIVNGLLIAVAVLALTGCKAAVQGQSRSSGGYKIGEPYQVNPQILETFEKSDIIPVIAPIGVGLTVCASVRANVNISDFASAVPAPYHPKRTDGPAEGVTPKIASGSIVT